MEVVIALLIGLLYFLFFGACAIIIIYLIIKRLQNRGNEGFEERDN